MQRPTKPIVLIADFFGTLKARGIPAYVQELSHIASDIADVRILQAPRFLASAPKSIQNILMVLHEQLYVPLVALLIRPTVILFPYNSTSLICSLSKRTACVVHDLIPYRRAQRRITFAFLYLWVTTTWHSLMKRRFVGVSPHTMRILRSIPRFAQCDCVYIPNTFAGTKITDNTISNSKKSPPRLTLVSGNSQNKDFRGALHLYSSMRMNIGKMVGGMDVVGFGDGHSHATRVVQIMRDEGVQGLDDIRIHGLLSRQDLDQLLRENGITWAHSLAEGFGRAVVEGRLAGGVVLMSRLGVFKPFTDDWCYPYKNGDSGEFQQSLTQALVGLKSQIDVYRVVDELQTTARQSIGQLVHGK